MAAFTLDEAARATGGRPVPGKGPRRFRSVATDTRTLRKGALYVALKGDRFDGHAFVDAAFDAGAACAVVSDPSLLLVHPDRHFVLVADTLAALGDLAAFHRNRFPRLELVAVTGSNGKTTVKELTAAALATGYRVHKTAGNLNNLVGLPLTLLGLKKEHSAAVVELGMNHPGEIARLTMIARPTAGIVTNVAAAHIGNFPSLSAVRAAKGELLDRLPEGATAILNAGDPGSAPLLKKWNGAAVTFGGDGDIRIDGATLTRAGVRFGLAAEGIRHDGRLRLLGLHHAANAAAAVAAALACGVAPADALAVIRRVGPTGMRMNPVKLPGGMLLINDAYNANPASAAAAVETLAALKGEGRTHLLLGDMLELGERGVAEHAKLGALAARRRIDRFYGVGELARHAVAEAKRRGVAARWFATPELAGTAARKGMRPGDVALVKGSRGMGMERAAAALAGN